MTGAFAWRDLHLAQAQFPDPRTQAGLTRLGLDGVTISFALSCTLDPVQRHVSLHDTMLKVNELGTITLSADLTDVEPSLALLNAARLSHARLCFEDASLVDRLMRADAAQVGADPTVFRQRIAAVLQRRSAMISADNPSLAAWFHAISGLILSPHSLTVELSPSTPVAFEEIRGAVADPAALTTMLGLTAAANQPDRP